MYFPILRGKQYELLALREFASEISDSPLICPVIEPVKLPFKALETACNTLTTANVNFTIIANPIVGDISPSQLINQISNTSCLKDNQNFQLGLHIVSEGQLSKDLKLLDKYNLKSSKLVLVHHDTISKDYYDEIAKSYNIRFNFIHNKIKARRYRHYFDPTTKVDLEDVFDQQEKNSDYLRQEDQGFSDMPWFYEEENFIGFSDYMTIGETYSDGGFLPYAVAIHLTYAANSEVRIRHFVSDSNDDYSDTPGKFAEALAKLVKFTQNLTYKTKAIRTFEDYHKDGHYPGLGSIKKLSILNHLELIKYLLSNPA